MKTICGTILAAALVARTAFSAAVETTPAPRQSVDTWGWWKRCGDVHNHLVKNKGASYDVVFVGDSITHLWERTVDASGKGPYADLQREFKILNLGFSGDRTENVLWRFRYAGQLDGYTAKVFMLMIGTNNFNLIPCRPEDVKDGIVEIINEIRAKHPESKILLLPVFVNGKAGSKPSAKSRYMVLNEKYLPGLADGKTVFYQDINRNFLASDGTIPDGLLRDGLHLTTHGYSIWRDAVLPFLSSPPAPEKANSAIRANASIPSPREIRGPFPILSVAYHKDGSVDYGTIVEEARYVDKCGCPGVIWGQSDDAVDFLTLREKELSYEALAKGMQGRNIVLVFGCNGATTEEMLACVDAAQKVADRYPATKIALSARPPDDTRTLEDLERAWRRLGEAARRPCILQTFTPGKTPTPSVDLLVRLAADYPVVFGYVKEESGGRNVNERIAMLNAAKPTIKNVFAARGGWSWLFQARQFGAEGLISERCAFAPLLAKIWREMEKGEKADQIRLTMGYALYRLMIDQRDFDNEPIKLRGYRLYFLQKAGVFKNRTSRIPVHPPGVVGKEWRLEEDVPLTEAQKRELDALYDAMMAF